MENKIKNKRVLGLFIIILILAGSIMFVFNKPTLTGYATWYGGEKISKLRLRAECSCEPDVYRVWRVKNRNDINVEYDWVLENSEQNGTRIAEPGKSYFNTTTINGTNQLTIYVNETQQASKTSNWTLCGDCPEPEPCVENWTCGDWTECIDENQTRECNDLNNCNTTVEIPILIQECEMPCVESWTCTNWTECVNLSQNRICNDVNNCSTEEEMPNLIQECEEIPINETSNETEEPEPEPEAQPASSGGTGGGGTGNERGWDWRTPKEETAEESEETPAETEEETPAEIETETEQKEVEEIQPIEEPTGFAALMGNTVRFFEDRAFDYKLGLIMIALSFVLVGISINPLANYIRELNAKYAIEEENL